MSDPAHATPAERAEYHLAAMRRREEREATAAQALLDDFVTECLSRGIAPVPLRARPWSGRGSYRTDRSGWYLRPDRSIGVDVDGRFLVLVVAPVALGRWRTVQVGPSRPALQVGRGARDGESIGLAELLALRLDDPVR